MFRLFKVSKISFLALMALVLMHSNVPSAFADTSVSSVLGTDSGFSPNYAAPVGETATANYFKQQRRKLYKSTTATEPPAPVSFDRVTRTTVAGGPGGGGSSGGSGGSGGSGSRNPAAGVAGGINDQALACYSWRILAILEGNFGAVIMMGAGIVVLVMCLTGNYRSIYSALGVIAISYVLRDLVPNFYSIRTCDPQAVGGVFTTDP